MQRYIVDPQETTVYVYDTEEKYIVCQTTRETQALLIARALNAYMKKTD